MGTACSRVWFLRYKYPVRRVLDHMSSVYEPIGGNAPMYGDSLQGKAWKSPIRHMRRSQEAKSGGSDTHR